MNLPEYKPLSQTTIPLDFLYDDYVAHYGPPPEGYQWLKRCETIPDGSIVANARLEKWQPSPLVGWGRVDWTFYAVAAPIIPPMTNNTSATQLTVRECVEYFQKQSQTGRWGERRQAYAECAEFLEKNCSDYV